MRLWRAMDRNGYTGQWSCWSECREDAEAYLDNPGYGGDTLHVAEVDLTDARILDLTEGNEFLRLASALYDDEDERFEAIQRWSGQGLGYAYEVWENNREAARLLAERYDWVVYVDDYPDGAITWCYLGTEPLAAEEVS